jgi:hypothetical protein
MDLLVITKLKNHLHLYLEDKELAEQYDKLTPQELMSQVKARIQKIDVSQFTRVNDQLKKV